MDYLTEFDWRDVPIEKNENGGLYFYAPDHPLASSESLQVNLARHIVSVSIGRWLTPHEYIKYKDGDLLNIDIENLLLKHLLLKHSCDNKYAGKVQASRLTSDELLNLGWRYLPRDAAKILNVSESFFYNQCKAMRVSLPSPRYWLFLKTVKSRSAALMMLGWSNDAIIALNEKLGESISENIDMNPYPPDTDYMANFDWRTAALKNRGGRMFFYAPDHPLASKKSENFGWVCLAKHIVSVSSGCWLTRWDHILYKDGNRQNIDLGNLLVQRTSVPRKHYPRFSSLLDEIWNTVWHYPRSETARLLGTTGNTLARYCKREGILTPPPGYWTLVKCGMSPTRALTHLGWQEDVLAVLRENVDDLFQNEDTLDMLPAIDYLKNFDWRTAEIKNRPRGLYFIARKHPLATKNSGDVNLARHIMSVERGKWLEANEVIYYKDGNHQNIDLNNLLVVKRGKNRKSSSVELVCPICGKSFKVFASRVKERVTDTPECKKIWSRKSHYTANDLWVKLWQHPQRDVVKMLMVNKRTLRSRCAEFGVTTPPMGYWNLIQASRSREEALLSLGWDVQKINYVNSMLMAIIEERPDAVSTSIA